MDSQDSPRPGLGESHHLPPYSILCGFLRHLHSNGFLSRPGLDSRDFAKALFAQTSDRHEVWSKLVALLEGFPTVCRTLLADPGVGLIPDFYWSGVKPLVWLPTLLFCHNLCCGCPNGPCEPIFDIYILIFFQWYKEHPNVRCFDPCNQTLKFRKSRRIPKSPFRECEFHPHTLSK